MHRKKAYRKWRFPSVHLVRKSGEKNFSSDSDELFGCCCVCVFCCWFHVCECVKKVSRKSTAVHTGDIGDSRDGARNTLRNANRLDDLEDCGTAHHEDEQRQQPRSDGVLLLGVLRRLGDVSALGDVAAGLLVGHADSLLGGHCADVVVGLRANHSNKRGRIGRYGNYCFVLNSCFRNRK